MNTNEQGIIKMLQDKISESEDRIKSFRQAIAALSGGSSASAPSAQPKRRGRKPGSKNKPKAAAAPKVAAPAKAVRRRRRRPGRPKLVVKAAVKATAKAAPSRKAAAKPKAARKPRAKRSGETMESWVMKQFDDNTPKTARQLMDIYNKQTGKNLEMNGFSARLAIVKKKGGVKSMKNDSDGLSYNGKAEWFDNGKLKKDYMLKA